MPELCTSHHDWRYWMTVADCFTVTLPREFECVRCGAVARAWYTEEIGRDANGHPTHLRAHYTVSASPPPGHA